MPPRFLETCEPLCYMTISFVLLHYIYLLWSGLVCELHEFSSVIFRNEYEYRTDVRGVVYFLLSLDYGKKVKCTLVQALKLCTGRTAHRGSRGIALLFHDHSTRKG